MTHSRVIRISLLLAVLAVFVGVSSRARDDAGDLVKRGRRAADDGRFAEAESSFARAAAVSNGKDRAQALLLRAGIVRSGKDAETLYRRVLDATPSGEYAEQAVLELAKIEFAMGRYEGAYTTLSGANACDDSDEACLFEGMAAIMLKRYSDAVAPLEHVRKGQARVWAAMSLAEASAGTGDDAKACAQYASLAQARVNPAAWYRHAECLEKAGDDAGARKAYQALSDAFPQSPEGVRAGKKLTVPSQPAEVATPAPAPDVTPRGAGYTVQFGSFGDRSNAARLSAEIKKTYPAVRIDSELINYHEVFRVRFGFYATRDAAHAAGEQMSKTLNQPYTIMPVPASQ